MDDIPERIRGSSSRWIPLPRRDRQIYLKGPQWDHAPEGWWISMMNNARWLRISRSRIEDSSRKRENKAWMILGSLVWTNHLFFSNSVTKFDAHTLSLWSRSRRFRPGALANKSKEHNSGVQTWSRGKPTRLLCSPGVHQIARKQGGTALGSSGWQSKHKKCFTRSFLVERVGLVHLVRLY